MLEESEVFTQALALSDELRAELAKQLIRSLDTVEKEPGYDEAWAAELEERYRKYKSGEVQALDGDEVLARMRQRIRARRSS